MPHYLEALEDSKSFKISHQEFLLETVEKVKRQPTMAPCKQKPLAGLGQGQAQREPGQAVGTSSDTEVSLVLGK